MIIYIVYYYFFIFHVLLISYLKYTIYFCYSLSAVLFKELNLAQVSQFMTICKWFFSLHLKFPSKWIPRKVVQCKSAADRSPPQPHPHIIIIIDVHMQRKKRRKNWKKKKEAASKCRRNCFMLIASLPKLFLFFFFLFLPRLSGCDDVCMIWSMVKLDMAFSHLASQLHLTALDP